MVRTIVVRIIEKSTSMMFEGKYREKAGLIRVNFLRVILPNSLAYKAKTISLVRRCYRYGYDGTYICTPDFSENWMDLQN